MYITSKKSATFLFNRFWDYTKPIFFPIEVEHRCDGFSSFGFNIIAGNSLFLFFKVATNFKLYGAFGNFCARSTKVKLFIHGNISLNTMGSLDKIFHIIDS